MKAHEKPASPNSRRRAGAVDKRRRVLRNCSESPGPRQERDSGWGGPGRESGWTHTHTHTGRRWPGASAYPPAPAALRVPPAAPPAARPHSAHAPHARRLFPLAGNALLKCLRPATSSFPLGWEPLHLTRPERLWLLSLTTCASKNDRSLCPSIWRWLRAP